MWRCTNCSHLEVGAEKPSNCPVCGNQSEYIVRHEVSGITGDKTLKNLKTGYIAESQARIRNRAYSMKADEEGLPQIAAVFRAVSEAESVHAYHHLLLLDAVSETQTNLESAFEHENLATSSYPDMIKNAIEDGNEAVARHLSFVRDVEKEHAGLYRKALDHMISEEKTVYYVCAVCGHIEDGAAPDECPICGAPKDMFRLVA